MWYINMEYYLTIKRNNVYIQVTTPVDLENIMLIDIEIKKKLTVTREEGGEG